MEKWVNYSSNLYQSLPEPSLREIASVPTEDALLLLENFTDEEIFKALDHQKSKAIGMSGVSPHDLKLLSPELCPILTKIFNESICSGNLPDDWLSSILFFLHKKESYTDPVNYRSIAIEDAFLKVFMTALGTRLAKFSENNDLLPDFQFGFRPHLLTTSAVTVLKSTIEKAFSSKKRVYAAFVDMKKRST